jgi:hypothetical protein
MLVQVMLMLISSAILMLSQLMLISSHSYFVASALNPALSYTMHPTTEMYRMPKDAFERMMDVESAVQALQEAEVFCNRLTHKKLNKLVYVNYNLRLQLEDVSNRCDDDEGDIIEHLGQLNFYDEKNLVQEWMEYGRSNREPVLGEEDEENDIPIPSQLVRDQIDPKDLQTATSDDCISDWARRNVGSSHIGKRMFQSGHKQGDPKHQKGKTKAPEKPVTSDASTDDGDG